MAPDDNTFCLSLEKLTSKDAKFSLLQFEEKTIILFAKTESKMLPFKQI